MSESRPDVEEAAEDASEGEAEDVASLEGKPLPERAAMSTVGLDPSGADLAFQEEPPFDSVEPQPVD